MNLNIFIQLDFLRALKAFFNSLKVPVNYIADEPVAPKIILSSTFRDNEAFQLMDDVYFVGMIDDAAFEGNKSPDVSSIHSDYDGVLIFGVTLKKRINGLLPTRGQLAEISRAFNREFHYTPVVVIFKYDGQIAFANTERLKYKQEWREGEKAGKVSVLRDVNIQNPHRGHLEILKELEIPTSGKNTVDSFSTLYKYWQDVFSVSILNKKFYNELQNWYFWAIKEVTFPNAPNRFDFETNEKFDEAIKEHKGKNVIRLLTRILFIWFIKEKKLIPEQLFDEKFIANKLIKDFTPQKPLSIFATGKQNSPYYRAILQNLFFATLNQEMGKRGFRIEGKNQNVTNLMRYKSYFKAPDYFVQLMEEVVPFMNGGLFECLDKPHPTVKGKQGGDFIIYNDGFSDRDDNQLVIPDYLFFDVDEDVDLSDDFGNKVYKNAKTRGLLEILQSYKFTITENTPIEEDVALDPELLGKVFENLLASYNPETKTTARKQTGSFYTPREIVNYMVDESLIAYLKNTLKNEKTLEEQLDKDLHQLLSYDNLNPYQANPVIQKQLIKALDQCTILDPACGSGAFPMGILQKMVHVLHKIDPKNTEWEQRQIDRVNKAIESLEEIDDVRFREQSIKELKAQIKDIEDSFENNELDYGRKLYLIENCIYGVDIQSIATQISKLRFFISLIVDQKIDKTKDNFGIRPLPNLETKFLAANTLIGINKPKVGDYAGSLYDNQEIKKLEAELKKVRHKLFSSKSPANKRKLREDDKELRNRIADLLVNDGWENQTARQLAGWDPYDQNESSSFFDMEWMFDISDGFDMVIGNPPYGITFTKEDVNLFRRLFEVVVGHSEAYYLFIEKSISILKKNGLLSFITPNAWLSNKYAMGVRKFILEKYNLEILINLNKQFVFENAGVETCVFQISKRLPAQEILVGNSIDASKQYTYKKDLWVSQENKVIGFSDNPHVANIWESILTCRERIDDVLDISNGFKPYQVGYGLNKEGLPLTDEDVKSKIYHSNEKLNADYVPQLKGKNINKYFKNWTEGYICWGYWLMSPKDIKYYKNDKILVRQIISNTLICTIDRDGYYADQTLYIGIIRQKSEISLEYCAAFLNSKLLGFFFRTYFSEDDDLFPKIKVNELKNLPFRRGNFTFNNIIKELVTINLEINSNGLNPIAQKIEDVMDALFFQLFFEIHMKEREIDVLKFVERDINEVMQGREFEKLKNTDKELVVGQLHQKWTHPDNEVRNRIKLFAVRSPEILKPILEG